MGSNNSKTNNVFNVIDQQEEKDFAELVSNPDPRSPTPEIVRTPLQGKSGAKHNITKNADLRKTFESADSEEKLIHNNPILSAVIKNHLQSYDPRSPTQDFERTPIVIVPNKEGNTDENYGSPCFTNNESCSNDSLGEISPDIIVPKNLCDGYFDVTLNDTLKEEPLGSSTVSNDAIENNISQETANRANHKQLLETNFDYVSDSDKNNECEQNNFSTRDESNVMCKFKVLSLDPRSPSIGIERTPIVIAKTDDNVESMSDDTLIKVLQNTNTELRQNAIMSESKNSDGLLIYEDESASVVNTPKKSKSAKNGVRTPLSCMKNKTDSAHARSKSVNTLYNAKSTLNEQLKTTKRISHIPRLKALVKPSLATNVSSVSLKIANTAAVSGDCENTPPQSNRDCWDKNSSIVL